MKKLISVLDSAHQSTYNDPDPALRIHEEHKDFGKYHVKIFINYRTDYRTAELLPENENWPRSIIDLLTGH